MAGVMEFEGEVVRSCHIILLLLVNLTQRTNRQVIQEEQIDREQIQRTNRQVMNK